MFGWVLDAHTDVRCRILGELFSISGDSFEEAKIVPQFTNESGKRPDFLIEAPDFLGYIECKVASPFIRRQWDGYVADLEKRADRAQIARFQVAYIAKTLPVQDVPTTFPSLKWSDVHNILSLPCYQGSGCNLLSGFRAFLENMRMSINPINQNARAMIEFRKAYEHFVESCRKICDELITSLELQLQPKSERFLHRVPSKMGKVEERDWYYGAYFEAPDAPIAVWVGLVWPDEGDGAWNLGLAIQVKSVDAKFDWASYESDLAGGNKDWRLTWNGWSGRTRVIDIVERHRDFLSDTSDQQIKHLVDLCLAEFDRLPHFRQ